MSLEVIQTKIDGRQQRSERSKTAILNAALALVDEGILAPTAKQIAAEAGVGLRSFFRHFEDMEALYAAIHEYSYHHFEQFFTHHDRSGTLDERIIGVCRARCNAYSQVQNYMLSGRGQAWRSGIISQNYNRNQLRLRQDLEAWLPEMGELSEDGQQACEAITSFDMWNRLSNQQGRDEQSCVGIMKTLLASIIFEGQSVEQRK